MNNTLFDVEDKVILITGAAGGIGSVIAEALVRWGAKLVASDCDLAAMRSVAQSFQGKHEPLSVVTHVENRDECIATVERATKHFGSVDVLINSAGVNTRMRPEQYDQDTWNRIININLGGTFNMCQAVFPVMAGRGGKIINFGSILSVMANSMTGPYAASKGGVVQLTRSLACAWAENGINVNAILPGWIDTALSRQARIDIPGHAERVVETTPMKRWGVPQDIVGAAFFLATEASDFITGTSITVDGGVTAHV